ncbi:LLM class flavin-dependent oxidoreductase [Pseudoxanthomonas sp.]|uniref:LLM class flavin-dependent oxidoreductase n=1 Tax=Pseudoxanthomonas sp. TaxID=1871049 RepID=UPI002626B8BE|nr:LLM class flavin-dependent oxidoreductase [Pseudoxanthomonas sp.]WDS36622.1 MAG: LLM class flavin-dependent oxidoreductase [Pseudoxanthomonas sp.]
MELRHLAFLTPGSYPPDDPRTGLEAALALIAFGEQLGYDGAWVRHRHLEPGISSAAVFLAAASQHTRRIELGTAVIQLGYETPFRLAEDLSLLDALAGARLQVGVSTGAPPFAELLGPLLFDTDPARIDFSHARVLRLIEALQGNALGTEEVRVGNAASLYRPRLQPFAPGLAQRVWYGAGSLESARWAGLHGLHLLLGNVNRAESHDDFVAAQLQHLAVYRAALPAQASPRIAAGRVVVPTDGVDAATRRRLLDFAAQRRARTESPQGPRRTMFAPDVVGSTAQIVDALSADPVLQQVNELRVELPYELPAGDYRRILQTIVERVAPALGWQAQPQSAQRLRAAP